MEKKYEYIARQRGEAYLENITYEESVKRACRSLRGIDESLLDNKHFVMEVLQKGRPRDVWVHISKPLQQDVDVCMHLLKRNMIGWNMVPTKLKNNRNIIFKAANHLANQNLFESHICARRDLIEYLLNKPYLMLSEKIAQNWFDDDYIMRQIIMKSPQYYSQASNELKSDPALAFFCAKMTSSVLRDIPAALWDNEPWVKAVCHEVFAMMHWLPQKYHTRYDLVLNQLKWGPDQLRDLSEEARNDPVIVAHACSTKNHLYSYEAYIGEQLRNELNANRSYEHQFEYLQKMAQCMLLEKNLQQQHPVSAGRRMKI